MVIGFLVPHRCGEPAIGSCAKCQRRYCQEHLKLSPAGLLCTACADGRDQPVGVDVVEAQFGDNDLAAFVAAEAIDRSDDGAAFSDLS
jgi:hypothetical protein